MNNARINDTRDKITDAAWALFCEHGYENVTLDDILEAAHVSRGTFYYHFDGKDEVLLNVTHIFDEDYKVIEKIIPPDADAFAQLLFVDHQFFKYLEDTVPVELVSRILSTQLKAQTGHRFMDRSRFYNRLCRRIIEDGQRSGVFRTDFTVSEISMDFAVMEWGMMYDWCVCGGEFSLASYAKRKMPLFLAAYRADYTAPC